MNKQLRIGNYTTWRFYNRTWFIRPVSLILGTVLLSSAVLIGFVLLSFGSFSTTTGDIWHSFIDPNTTETHVHLIIQDIRLPRIILALLVGSMLGLAGAAMQSVTRNGLADPGLIGVKEGSLLAIVLTLILFPSIGNVWLPIVAMAGGFIVAMSVILMARSLSGVRFILIGIGVSWALGAFISFFIVSALISDVQAAMVWLAGSLHSASWDVLTVTLPWAGLGLILLLMTIRSGGPMVLDNDIAVCLGVNHKYHIFMRLVAPVILTAASVAAVGSMGFVGLVAPHLARLIFGTHQLPFMFGSAICGALLVLVADGIGRLAFAPLQIPAGAMMAIIGLPFLLFLLWLRRDTI